MRPLTLAILTLVLLVGSVGLRKLIVHFGWLPVSEEVVLKKATALTVTYYDKQKPKTQVISDPAELREVLAVLKINPREDHYGYYYGVNRGFGATVEFRFPDGSRQQHAFEGRFRLGGFLVDGAFYDKLAAIISRREGKAVDLSSTPPQIPGQGFGKNRGVINDDNPGGEKR